MVLGSDLRDKPCAGRTIRVEVVPPGVPFRIEHFAMAGGRECCRVVIEVPSQRIDLAELEIEQRILIAVEHRGVRIGKSRSVAARPIDKIGRLFLSLANELRKERCAGKAVETVTVRGNDDTHSHWLSRMSSGSMDSS